MFDRLELLIGSDNLNKIEDKTVLIVGVGGVGGYTATSLARSGIKNIIIIDFDKVDITNINRQQYIINQIGTYKTEALSKYLKQISPYINIIAHTEKLSYDNYEMLLNNADIICEAFDKAEEKSKLSDFVMENMPDKYLVCASGMAGIGSANSIKTRKITDHFYLCGDGVSDILKGDSLFSSRVMLCAAHQAHTVLRIISGQYEI